MWDWDEGAEGRGDVFGVGGRDDRPPSGIDRKSSKSRGDLEESSEISEVGASWRMSLTSSGSKPTDISRTWPLSTVRAGRH